ncbi:6-phosphogluconolactonase [Pontibacter anaerobius]|uniref:6-phosphogluconolactonase n=1 Tax=Pontibacter anaerobius TaxID=2993940 RepID=A0ABT3RCN7_9BACT|nr:6-phosphogluconolactonase [Pontibacter anaerobius]MCX2739045.1 6-phosphogluconolactonase [Pontibacter anaerobius]
MVTIFKDTAYLSQQAAELFVQAAQEAVQKNGRFTVALTGGSSPKQLYQLLAQAPYKEQVPWQQTYIFWGDERWVPLTDERSNAKMAKELLLDKVPVPQEQIYPMWDEMEPEKYAQKYEQILKDHFQDQSPAFDLILLGMGDDGHTASLFPGTEVLQEKSSWVQAYYLAPQSMYRITLTAPLINQAKRVLFMTFGDGKAQALHEVLEGERNPEQYPSQLINPLNGSLYWYVDDKAASRLEKFK